MACASAPSGGHIPTQDGTAPSATLIPRALLKQQGYVAIPLDHVPREPDDSVQQPILYAQASLDSMPLRLMLDAGFYGSFALDGAMASVLGVHGTPLPAPAGQVSFDTTRLSHVMLGPFQLEPQALVILPEYPLANGALGANFFGVHACILDYTTDTLYVRATPIDPSGVPPSSFSTPPGYVAVPLERIVRGTPPMVEFHVQVTVDTTNLSLLLDTGAQQEMVLGKGLADVLKLHVASKAQVWGVFGKTEVGTGVLDRFVLGSVTLPATHFQAALEDISVFNADTVFGFPKVSGVLGGALLAAHGALVDFGRNVLYIRKH